MLNITINGKNFEVNGETPVKLLNGSLILHYNKLGDIIGAYIVTSYRSKDYGGESPSTYCSLVSLETGYIQFKERCSRYTTVKRVLAHLNNRLTGEQAVKDGQYIEVYPREGYKIDLQFSRKAL